MMCCTDWHEHSSAQYQIHTLRVLLTQNSHHNGTPVDRVENTEMCIGKSNHSTVSCLDCDRSQPIKSKCLPKLFAVH